MSKLQFFPPPLSKQGNHGKFAALMRHLRGQHDPTFDTVHYCCFKHSRECNNFQNNHLHWSNKYVSIVVEVWISDDKGVIALRQHIWPTAILIFISSGGLVVCAICFVAFYKLSFYSFLNLMNWNWACLIHIAFIFTELPPKEPATHFPSSNIMLVFLTKNN